MISLNHNFSLAVGFFVLCAGSLAIAQNAPVALPFEADFEADTGYAAGPLLSDSVWNQDPELDTEIFSFGAIGSQSLGFTGNQWLWLNTLGLAEGEVTWIDFYLKPVFNDADELPEEIESEQSAVAGFVKVDLSEGEVYAVDGDGLGSGQWLPSGERTALDGNTSEDWVRLTYRLDYASKQWDLFVDGKMAVTDLGFLDDTVLKLTEFATRGDADETSILDYFYAGGTNPLFEDTSNDGLPDAWLTAQGLTVLGNQRYGDGDSDGLDNLTEFKLSTRADLADTDGDGADDGVEIANGIDPNNADTDSDGAQDGIELSLGSNPLDPDTDYDGAQDGPEIANGTDPLLFDTDADGLADSLEAVWALDPLVADAALATLAETEPGSGIFEWSENFSAEEGYVDAALSGQQAWSALGNVLVAAEQVDVTDSITEDASFERLAGIGETRQVWISFRAKLVAGDLPDVATLAEPAVAVWGAGNPEQISVWDEASQQWVAYDSNADVTQWNDYALYFDYVEQQWLLTQNGVLIANGLSFKDEDLIVFSRFKALQGRVPEADVDGARSVASFDDFKFSNTEPEYLDYDGDGLLNSIETGLEADILSCDTDQDGLGDLWEYQNGLNLLVNDSSLDADGDGLVNLDEFEYGLNPQENDVDGALGFVRRDIWTGVVGEVVTDFTQIESFPTAPNQRLWLNSLNLPSSARPGNYYGQRIYGYIIAPESAEYTFWIASADSSELWLSSDSSPFHRERICYLNGRVGHQEWDRLLTQKSLNVSLQAGQAYYFEILHKDAKKNGRVAVAWQYGSKARNIISGEFLGTSIPELGDFDQDGLPDDWEIANGLDPQKGFGVDGYAGDLDGDGLLNHQERQVGTAPALSDTDGDGYSDLFELQNLNSDPLSANETQWSSVSTLSPSQFSVVSGEWNLQGAIQGSGSGGGMITTQISLSEAGIYQLEGVLTRIDDSPASAAKPVELLWYLDGEYLGISSILPDSTAVNFDLFKRLGYQKAGNHSLSLRWLNVHRDAVISLDSLSLVKSVAESSEALAIWTEAEIAKFAYSTSIPQASQVSPVCIEGRADVLAALQISPSAQPIRTGAGHWYSDVSLTADEVTTVSVSFQNGGRVENHSIQWLPTNVFDQDGITIRVGDSLKLAGVPDGSTGGSFNVTLNGVNVGAGLNDYVVHLFDTAGEFSATVDYTAPDGTVSSNSMIISVVNIPVVPEPAVVWAGRSRTWEWAQLPSNVFVEAVGMEIDMLSQSQSTTNFTLGRDEVFEDVSIIARLNEGGPIVATVPVRGFSLQASVEGYLRASKLDDTTNLVENEMHVFGLPDDIEIKINVFRSGVVLDDGNRYRYLSSQDFDSLGRYTFHMVKPRSLGGAACHHIEVYEGGKFIGRR